MKIIITIIAAALLIGCTANERVKNWGGKSEIELDSGKKLVNMTWKEDHLWILTREMREGESVETYSFKEKSSYGVVQGEYVIKEKK